jgi:hypothetical protein
MESDSISDFESKQMIRVQLIIGIIGVPLLIASLILLYYAYSFPLYGIKWQVLSITANRLGIVGTVLTVVGSIAVIKRNGSQLGWVFVVVLGIKQLWRYLYPSVILHWLYITPSIDFESALITINYAYDYSIIFIALYAWLSIRSTVANRPMYLTYLILFTLGRVTVYLINTILYGFAPPALSTFEELIAYNAPYIIITILTYVVFFLFFVSQFYDSRTEQQFESIMTESENW